MIINTLFVIDQAMLGEHGAFNAGAVATARERLHWRGEVVWKMEPLKKNNAMCRALRVVTFSVSGGRFL